MKKKIILLLLAAVLCISVMGCSKKTETKDHQTENSTEKSTDKDEWIKEDFYVYDLNGKLIDYPWNRGITYSYNDPEALKIQTYKGIKINDSAKVALVDYDFTNFIVEGSQWPVLGSLDDRQKNIKKKFAKRYPDKNDRVLHNEELSRWGLSLFICGHFYEEDGKLYPIPLDSSGERTEDCSIYPQYTIYFRILNGKVAEIYFGNSDADVQPKSVS